MNDEITIELLSVLCAHVISLDILGLDICIPNGTEYGLVVCINTFDAQEKVLFNEYVSGNLAETSEFCVGFKERYKITENLRDHFEPVIQHIKMRQNMYDEETIQSVALFRDMLEDNKPEYKLLKNLLGYMKSDNKLNFVCNLSSSTAVNMFILPMFSKNHSGYAVINRVR